MQLEFEITSDAWWECEVVETYHGMHLNETFHHFLADNYGDGVRGVFVVLNCHHPESQFKTRIQLDSSDKTLHMDVMLDFDLMTTGGVLARRRHILEKLGVDVPMAAAKYSSPTFDGLRFGRDFREWIKTYPDYPVPQQPSKTSDPRGDRLSAKDGEFKRIVQDELGPLMSRLGFEFRGESKGKDQHFVTFVGGERSVGIFEEFDRGTVGIQPMVTGQRLMEGRMLKFHYVRPGPDSRAPLELFTMANGTKSEIARLPASVAGDFSQAMKALAEFFESHPQILFPG